MTDGIHLNRHHQVTVEGIFRHPVGHNIEWHDVLALLEKIGTAEAQEMLRALAVLPSRSDPRPRRSTSRGIMMRRCNKSSTYAECSKVWGSPQSRSSNRTRAVCTRHQTDAT